jgi:hypothetical protein
MRKIQGEHDEHLVVSDALTIQGSVLAGATVRSGGRLLVKGAFTGQLTVEEGASAHVEGSFNVDIASNEGLVFLYGQVDLDWRPGVGRVLVGIDSVLTHDGAHVLRPDGTVERLESRTYGPGSFNVETDKVCVYVEDEGRFVPVPL